MLAAAMVLVLTLSMVPAQGAVPAEDEALAGHPEGSYVMENGAVAVPLKEPSPDWVTEEVRQKAHLAAQMGLGYDVENDTFVHPSSIPMSTPYLFIRPGAWMVTPSWCTLGFVHSSSKISTAGHCVSGGGEVIVVTAPNLVFAIGTGRGHAGGVGNDYGYVKVYDQFQQYVDPDTAVVGGPGPFGGCGGYTDEISITNPQPVKHVGHGIGIGTGGTPRAGVSLSGNGNDALIEGGFSSNTAVFWDGAAAPGDSGSPVLTVASGLCPLGEGLAILTHLVLFGDNAQYIAGTSVSKVGTPMVGNGLPT